MIEMIDFAASVPPVPSCDNIGAPKKSFSSTLKGVVHCSKQYCSALNYLLVSLFKACAKLFKSNKELVNENYIV